MLAGTQPEKNRISGSEQAVFGCVHREAHDVMMSWAHRITMTANESYVNSADAKNVRAKRDLKKE